MKSKTIKGKKRNKKVAQQQYFDFKSAWCWTVEWQTSQIRSDLLPIKQNILLLSKRTKKNWLKVLISLVSNRTEFAQYTFLCQRSQLWLLCYDSIYFLKSDCMKWGRIDFSSLLSLPMENEMKSIFQYMFIVRSTFNIFIVGRTLLWMQWKWLQNFGLSDNFEHIVNNLNHVNRNAGAFWHFVSFRNAFPLLPIWPSRVTDMLVIFFAPPK